MRGKLLVILAPIIGMASADPVKAPNAIVKLLDAQASAMLGDRGVDKVLAADALTDIQNDLMGPASIKVGTPAFGWTGSCGWVAVEATIRSHTHPEMQADGAPALQPPRPWHWLELVVADGTGYATKAMGLYATMPDSSLGDGVYNDVKELPAEASPSQLVGWLAHPAELAKHLSADPQVAVYGTSAADRAVGPAAAKKLLASWSKLDLQILASKPGTTLYDHHELVVGECAAATARIRMRYKDGALVLQAFAIAHKLPTGWEVVALQYATHRAY